MLRDDLGAKAPSSSGVCPNNDFLTLDMVRWYYGDRNTIDIEITDLSDRETIITISEVSGDKIRSRNFTIGLSIKRLIYNNYNFYHNPNNIC